jgi:hypothetical protein
MSQRERLLAAAVALIVMLWGATVGWDRYQATFTNNQNQQITIEQELSEARIAAAQGLQAESMLRGWQQQSLPKNLDIAKTLYQDWLRQELVDAGLIVREVNENSLRGTRQYFRQVTYSVNAQGSLEELAKFLYGFYQSNHLHRISAATLTPTTTRRSLTVSLTIDALSLSDCPRNDELAEGSSESFAEPLEEIRDEIVSRNVFIAYEPPEEEKPVEQVVEKPDDTPAEEATAFVTSLNQGEEGWQMAVRMSDSGSVKYFRVGDEISIGRFSGLVEEIDRRRVIVTQDEKRLVIFGGQNLGQAIELSDPS